MVLYGDTARDYPYTRAQRKKQKYSLVTRVIDFANAPITSGGWSGAGNALSTTAWAANDVLEVVQIRAGQTILGVQIQILKRSSDNGDCFDVGYGSEVSRWGRYWTMNDTGVMQDTYKSDAQIPSEWGVPLYFAAADTIDFKILKAVIQGKVRIIVHLLEDDR